MSNDTWLAIRFTFLTIALAVTIADLVRRGWRANPVVTRRVLVAVGGLAVAAAVVVLLVARQREARERAAADRQAAELRAAKAQEEARFAAMTPQQRLDERLGRVRGALLRYWADHQSYPAFLWSGLTESHSHATFGGIPRTLGPYLSDPVENPITGSSEVSPWGFGKAGGGWEYDWATGRVRPAGTQG
jgi:hypothetical protein